MKGSPNPSPSQRLRQFDARVSERASVFCGIDEAGRGPLAGPVVAAAAIVKDYEFDAAVDDSKKLSPRRRELAYSEILRKCRVAVAVVSEARIDEVNIFRASVEAMTEAFRQLGEKPQLALVDGPMPLELGCPLEKIINGDGISFAIACASIVAKVTRDRIMLGVHDRFPRYGFDRHKGYGTPEHFAALAKFGPCPAHRRSFAPVSALTA